MAYAFTVEARDVGKVSVERQIGACEHCGRGHEVKRFYTGSSFGPFQKIDIGKRVYYYGNGVYQMEGDDQLRRRLARSAK